MKKILLGLLSLLYISMLSSQVSSADYWIDFDTISGEFLAHAIINEGTATTPQQLFNGGGALVLVTPKEMSITNIESINPGPLTWDIALTELEPTNYPNKNFYQILASTQPVAFYDGPLSPGDTVLLFKATASHNMHGPDGIRAKYDDSEFVGLTNNLSISFTNIYNSTRAQGSPDQYAETSPINTFIGIDQDLTPVSGGTWVNSDPTVATLNGSVISNIAAGFSIFTRTPDNGTASSSTLVRVTANDPISDVSYKIEYNENDNRYDCIVVVNQGAGITTLERIQGSATFSVVTPKDVSLLNVTSVAPSATNWYAGISVISPPEDPDHSFYQILTPSVPNPPHDILLPGDEVVLFKIELDYNLHSQNGIRNFENATDLIGNPADIHNNFNLLNGQVFTDDVGVGLPDGFLEITGEDTIFLAGLTTVSHPVAGGTFMTNDASIATVDAAGNVTGVSAGSAIITYTPPGGNPSSVRIVVEGSNPLSSVNYIIEYDEATCLYNCSLIALTGNAVSTSERLQLASTFSVTTPKDVSVSFDSSINPPNDRWSIVETRLAPPEDPTRNYYQVSAAITGPAQFYDPIFEGDTVLLFKLAATSNVFQEPGFRHYLNGVDPTFDVIDINNDFNIGNSTTIYTGNEPSVFPTVYATAASTLIDIGATTTVSPTTGGTWTYAGGNVGSYDPATFTVTGENEGCILMTFTPDPGNPNPCPSSVAIEVVNPPHDPVSEVDYQVKFNESTCEYDCYMKVITGSALTTLERTMLSSSYSVVVPAQVTLTVEDSYAPGNDSWIINQSFLAPTADPEHNYYHVVSQGNSSDLTLDFLYPGDEVLLFSISLDNNVQGLVQGIRLFDNVNDPANVPASMQNTVSLGGAASKYRQAIPTEFPSVFAESPSGTDIVVGQSVELTPAIDGTWTSSNVNVATIDSNMVTAFADGAVVMTYTPNDASICPSSVVLNVTTTPHDPISEVDYLITFDEEACNYKAEMIVRTGSALTNSERLAFGSSYTIVTPNEIDITFNSGVAPETGTGWDLSAVENAPATDPTKNFFHFVYDPIGAEQYDFIDEGDTVTLFIFDANYNIHYNSGIRNFNNDGTDIPVQSFQNQFNIGGISDYYLSNADQQYPEMHADTSNTSSIIVGLSTTVQSPISGTWSSSDETIATVDSNTGEVTGIAPGKVVVTLSPTDMTVCPSSVIIEVVANDPISEVDYILIWDEASESYIASFIARNGNAIATLERVQLGSSFSIVTPNVVTPVITSINPSNIIWEIQTVIEEPTSDPLHNYYQVVSQLSPPTYHDVILEGDTVALFSINAPYNFHGMNGVRIFENGVDLVGNPTDISNDFNIGGVSQQFQGNENNIQPPVFADTEEGYVIVTEGTANVFPVESPNGTWTNSDPTVATFDPLTGIVTGVNVGFTILTYTPTNGAMPSSVVIYVEPNLNSTVTSVDYKLEYDDATCDTYNVYLVVNEGSAYSAANLIQGNATVSIKTPKDVTVTFGESITPNASSWGMGDQVLSPPGDPNHNFFNFYPVLSGQNAYTELVEGQELLLFKIQLSGLAQGPKGIRLYENGVDDTGTAGSFLNGFTVGGVTEIYNGNQEGASPSNYAEAVGPSDIIVGGQTTLIPSTGGIWTNSDASIASLDDSNVVTGLALGTATFTFTPGSGCETQFSVNVVEEQPSIAVGIGTANPASSAVFDVYSTDKGILVPRMSQAERLCIVSPPIGLLVFQNDQNVGFYYFDGATWTRLDDTITNGTSSFQQTTAETSAMKSSQSEMIKMLKIQQDEMEKQLKEQAELIKQLKKESSNN